MRALVTGANGFLGTHVVSALLARGHQVRACVRPAAKVDELTALGVTDVFRADLRTTPDLAPAFAGVDILIHLAAAVSGGEDEMFASTVVGTERLLTAMSQTSCRRVLLASSFSVYHWNIISGTLDEQSPVTTPPALYGRDKYSIAKTWQEKITRRFADEHTWDLTVLRPGFIWGRDKAELAAFGQQIGNVQVVIGPTTHIPMTHVENCADFFVRAAEDPRAVGQTFNVVDGPGERIWSFVGEYLKGEGIKRLRVPVPYWPVYQFVNLMFIRVFKRNPKLPVTLIPACFESRLKPVHFTNRKAVDVLGWKPPLTHQQCLARTFGPRPDAVQRTT